MTRHTLTLRIPVPRLAAGTLANALGLAGLAALIAGIGGLTGSIWVAIMATGLVLCGLSYLAALHAQASDAAPSRPVSVPASAPTSRGA